MEVTDTPRGGWKWKDIKMFPPQKSSKHECPKHWYWLLGPK
jgi:hypothetical protein